MANKQHLLLIRKDIRLWNKWRKNNPSEIPDLSDANLCLANLAGANLGNANLWEADISKAACRRADFRGANLCFANLGGSDLGGADFRGADLTNADLGGANLRGANFAHAKVWGANLRRADLGHAYLGEADFNAADFSHADLTAASFRGATLGEALFANARLCHADFSHADMPKADFTQALVEWCVFADTDLSSPLGLKTVRHHAPSTVGIDTVYRSGGDIPHAFLRGAGVPDNFLTYMSLLATQPIRFYSCFVSFDPKDRGFAEQLRSDLQNRGVRCWLSERGSPRAAFAGPRSRPRVSPSAELLVLSENSVDKAWVGEEIETRAKNPSKSGNIVLFPLCLDAAAARADHPLSADIRHNRHMADFSGWESPGVYQDAFDRLFRDIRNRFPHSRAGKEAPPSGVPSARLHGPGSPSPDFPEASYKIIGENDCPLSYKLGDELKLSGKSVLFPYGKAACLVLIEDMARVHGKYENMDGKTGYGFRCSGCTGSVRLRYQEFVTPFVRESSDDTEAIVRLLGTFSMFQDLRADDIGQIVSFLGFKKFSKGATIMEKGDPGTNLYIILSGKIEVLGDGGISIAVMEKGEVFGEMSLLSGNPVGATIKVLEPVTVLYMTGRDFKKVLDQFPLLQMYFTRLLARRLVEVHDMRSEEFASGMVGKLSEMPPSELFQTLNINQKTGILTMKLPKGGALLAFREGGLVRAEYAGMEGKEAFYETLRQKEGRFKFTPELPSEDAQAEEIQDFMWLLMEGTRKMDEEMGSEE